MSTTAAAPGQRQPSVSEMLANRNKPDISPQCQAFDYYPNAEAWKPSATTTLFDWIDAIRSDEYAPTVGEVRKMSEAGDKAAADALKKKLPAGSLSNTIRGRRKNAVVEGRADHTGLVQIDIDPKDNPGWTVEAMRDVLKADPRVVAGFISPSGNGMKGVGRIPADNTTHNAAVLAIEAHFKARGLKIDPACKDPVRLCFVSHDPDAWIREDEGEEFRPVALAAVPDEDPGGQETGDTEEDEGEQADTQSRCHRSAGGGLIIRGNAGHKEVELEEARAMLAAIPYPGYDKWLKIANAVWDEFGEAGTPLLQEWAPEKKPGDYAEKFAHRLADVHIGTLVMFAKEHGWAPPAPVSLSAPPSQQPLAPNPKTVAELTGGGKNTIPANIFPVPAGDIGHDLAARHIFSVIGPSNRLFMRGTTVHEVAREPTGEHSLLPVPADRFVSMIETFDARVMRRELREDGTPRWRTTTFPASAAKVALLSNGAREGLPAIRQLVSAPVLVAGDGTASHVIGKGYHPHAGGTYVIHGQAPRQVPLAEAVELLLSILVDFDFASPGDISRAVASLLSPTMKIGGWIDDDFPLDLAEADQSQSGKTYRFRLIHAIYREHPSAIANGHGGVGSMDERVSTALINGRPFIVFDNFRGRMDSQILESAIRGVGKVSARALRMACDVDCTPFIWQLSTNGAELTRDLANRSIITRIRKRPSEHAFTLYPEGDVRAHIRANQPKVLGAVHAVVSEWAKRGRPMTSESRHDFRTWCRIMDWIVQNVFGLAPLLDGHREEQERTANPKLQWLRDVVTALLVDGYQGQGLTASDLAECAEEHDLGLPGRKDSVDAPETRVGKLLGRVFREAGGETVVVDGRRFTRQLAQEWDPISRHNRDRKTYVIEGAYCVLATPAEDEETQPEIQF